MSYFGDSLAHAYLESQPVPDMKDIKKAGEYLKKGNKKSLIDKERAEFLSLPLKARLTAATWVEEGII